VLHTPIVASPYQSSATGLGPQNTLAARLFHNAHHSLTEPAAWRQSASQRSSETAKQPKYTKHTHFAEAWRQRIAGGCGRWEIAATRLPLVHTFDGSDGAILAFAQIRCHIPLQDISSLALTLYQCNLGSGKQLRGTPVPRMRK
jgi:hypothetical protein